MTVKEVMERINDIGDIISKLCEIGGYENECICNYLSQYQSILKNSEVRGLDEAFDECNHYYWRGMEE